VGAEHLPVALFLAVTLELEKLSLVLWILVEIAREGHCMQWLMWKVFYLLQVWF